MSSAKSSFKKRSSSERTNIEENTNYIERIRGALSPRSPPRLRDVDFLEQQHSKARHVSSTRVMKTPPRRRTNSGESESKKMLDSSLHQVGYQHLASQVCLKFIAQFPETIVENGRGVERMHSVYIFFFPFDNSVEITELARHPKDSVEYSDEDAGKTHQLLKRHQVCKPTSAGSIVADNIFTIKDFYVGAQLVIYKRRYTIVDMEKGTKKYFMQNHGYDVNDTGSGMSFERASTRKTSQAMTVPSSRRDMSSSLRDISSSPSTLQDGNIRLKNKVENLKQKADSVQDMLEQRIAELEEMVSEISYLKGELATKNSQLVDARNMINGLNRTIDQLEIERREFKQLQEPVEDVAARKESLRLQKEIFELRIALKDVNQRNVELEDSLKVTSLKPYAEDHIEDFKAIRSDIAILRSQMQQQQQFDIGSVYSESSHFEGSSNPLFKEEAAQLRKDLELTLTELSDLKNKMRKQVDLTQKGETEIGALREELTESLQERKQLILMNEKIRKDKGELDNSSVEFQSQMDSLLAQLEESKRRVEQKDTWLEKYRRIISELETTLSTAVDAQLSLTSGKNKDQVEQYDKLYNEYMLYRKTTDANMKAIEEESSSLRINIAQLQDQMNKHIEVHRIEIVELNMNRQQEHDRVCAQLEKSVLHTGVLEEELKDRRRLYNEKQRQVDFLTENETRLENELAQSEHLRLHHEGESKSASDEIDEMENELKQLRSELVVANMSLNHSTSGQHEFQKLNDELTARSKELESRNDELQEKLTASEHEISRLQVKIENEAKHLSITELGLAKAHSKIAELEAEIKDLRGDLVREKDDLSSKSVEHLKKLAEAQDEILRLADDLSGARHEVGAKSAELNAKIAEVDKTQLLLVEAHQTIEKLIKDNEQLQAECNSMSSASNKELSDMRKELEDALRALTAEKAASIQSLQEEKASVETELKRLRDELSKALADVQKLSDEKVASEAERNCYQAKLGTKCEENDTLQKELAETRANKEVYHKQIDDLKEMLKNSEDSSEYEALLLELADLRKACGDLEIELELKRAECDEGNKNLAKSEGDFKAAHLKVTDLEADIKDRQDKMAEMKNVFTTQLSEMERNINFLTKNERRLEVELAQSEHLRRHHEGESKSTAEEIDEMEKELKQLRGDLVKANMALNHSMSNQENLETSLKIAQDKIAAIEIETNQLRHALSKVKDDLFSQSVASSKKLERSQHELMDLSNELIATRNDSQIKADELHDARSEKHLIDILLVKEQQTIRGLQEQLEKAQTEVSYLSSELSNSKQTILTTEAAHNELDNALHALATEKTAKDLFLSALQMEIVGLKKNEEINCKQISDVEEKLMCAQFKCDEATSELKKLELVKKQDMEQTMLDLNLEINKLKSECESTSNELEESLLAIAKLESASDNLETEVEHLRKELDHANSKISDSEKNLKVLAEQLINSKDLLLKQSSNQNMKNDENLEALKLGIDFATQKVVDLEAEIAAEREFNKKLREDKKELEDLVIHLRESIEMSQAEIVETSFSNEVDLLSAEDRESKLSEILEMKNSKIEILNDNLLVSKSTIHDLEEEFKDINIEFENQKQEIKRLQDQIVELNEKLYRAPSPLTTPSSPPLSPAKLTTISTCIECFSLKESLNILTDALLAQNAANDLLQEQTIILDTLEAFQVELQRRNDILVDDNTVLRDELAKLREHIILENNVKAEVNLTTEELNVELEALRRELAVKKIDYDDLMYEINDLREAVLNKHYEVDVIMKEKNEMHNAHESSKEVIKTLESDIEELQKAITPLKTRRNSNASERFNAIIDNFEEKSQGVDGPSPLRTPNKANMPFIRSTNTKRKSFDVDPLVRDTAIILLQSQVRGFLARCSVKKKMLCIPRVLRITLEGAFDLMKIHEALSPNASSSHSKSSPRNGRRASVFAELMSNFMSEVPHAYVIANLSSGYGKDPCCSIAKSATHDADHSPQWNEETILTISTPKSLNLYPQDVLTLNVFSQSGHVEDTFLGQANFALNRSVFFGRPLVLRLPLHHAYQSIYSNKMNEVEVPDVKDEPHGEIGITLQILSLNSAVADDFVEIQGTGIFGGYDAKRIWVVLREDWLYVYDNCCDLPPNYIKRIDCRKIMSVKERVFDKLLINKLPIVGVHVIMESGAALEWGWGRDNLWARKHWLRLLRKKFGKQDLAANSFPNTIREFTGEEIGEIQEVKESDMTSRQSSLIGLFDEIDKDPAGEEEEEEEEGSFVAVKAYVTPRATVETPRGIVSAVKTVARVPVPGVIGYTPHVLLVSVGSGKGLMSTHEVHKVSSSGKHGKRRPSMLAGFMSNFETGLPEAYVVVNSFVNRKGKMKVMSGGRVAPHPASHDPLWNEDIKIGLEGSALVVLSVFSKNAMTEDMFLGQITVDLTAYPELYSGHVVELKELALGHAAHPVQGPDDEEMHVVDIHGEGKLSLTLSIPNYENNLYGEFFDMTTDVYGGYDNYMVKQPVFFHGGFLYEYNNINQGKLKRTLDVKKIHSVEDTTFILSASPIPVEGFNIKVIDEDGRNTEVAWAWAINWDRADAQVIKNRWKTCLGSAWKEKEVALS